MRQQVVVACFLLLSATSLVAADFVKIRYTIWNRDGKQIEATAPGQAAVMALERMKPEWRAAIETMAIGDKKRVPVEEYEIESELLEIIKGPETPADLKEPAADAVRTRSGLATKVLREGTGMKKPGRRGKVVVHYTGWTADGRVFDSTILRGAPAEFRLDNVIAGWTEGMQLMVEGELRRFWIPAKLAYAEHPDKPQGMLVFDIELLEIR